jgi:hypothetical protein
MVEVGCINNIKEGVVCQEKVAPLITDSNHACFPKIATCGFQEEANEISLYQFFKMSRRG